MKHCTQCGHVLGLGRFCTNCGHPVAARHADPLTDPIPEVTTEPATESPSSETAEPTEPTGEQDWRTDTAERAPRPTVATEAAAVQVGSPLAPRVPPAVVEPPPPPRFPLFADEVAAAPAGPPVLSGEAEALAPAQDAAHDLAHDLDQDLDQGLVADDWKDDDWDEWEEEGRPRAVWAVAAVLVLGALVGGAWFLGQALGGDDETASDDATTGTTAPVAEAVDHTADASAEAPRTAPANEDVDGNPTTYDASNMLDGVPETAWRAAGDGEGIKLVFTFPEKTRITEVGLINGYAKTATDGAGKTFDWYAGHRRIEQVTWNFGAGPVVRQDLTDGRDLQTIEVDPVEVRKVVLKIIATTAPGEGPAGRDFTAISDVQLKG